MKVIVLFYSLLGCAGYCAAQSADLDPSFGVQGIVTTDLGHQHNHNVYGSQVLLKADGSLYVICQGSPTYITKRFSNGQLDSAYGINGYSSAIAFGNARGVFQSDGKIILASCSLYGGGSVLARINTNGTFDSSFGINGIQLTQHNLTAVCVKTNGKIVVTGFITQRSDDYEFGTYFIVCQYNSDGTIDSTFNGSGEARIDFVYKSQPGKCQRCGRLNYVGTSTCLLIQPDGKIVVGGYATLGFPFRDETFAIARFNASGSIDKSFDFDGEQTTTFTGGSTLGSSIALQADGKILLAGTLERGGDKYAITRYLPNGRLDSSFNGNGRQTVYHGGNLNDDEAYIAIQSDDKILIGGNSNISSENDLVIARLNKNGGMDNSFGSGGMVTTEVDSPIVYYNSLALQPDGKFFLAGSPAVVKYNTDGKLDDSFDGDGKLLNDYHQGNTVFNTSVQQPDGKLLVAGVTWNGLYNDCVVARYNSNGSLDKSFGNKGWQITDFGGFERVSSIVLQSDGKILVGGSSLVVARYNTDGSPDISFNGDGKLTPKLIGNYESLTSLALQSDGKMVLAIIFQTNNYDPGNTAIARLNSDGTLDSSFSEDGVQLTNFTGNFNVSLVIQNDGKIVMGGSSSFDNDRIFALARFNTDGSPDVSFSGDGKQSTVFGPGDYYSYSIALQKDGKIVLAGTARVPVSLYPDSNYCVVARYNINGDLDSTFNKKGYQSTYIGSSLSFSISVAIKDDGRIAVGGYNDNFIIVLYNSDGSLDSTFEGEGIKISSLILGKSGIERLIFDHDKLYGVGYGYNPGELGMVARYLFTKAGPLPLTLLNFKATLQKDNIVLLDWETAHEDNLSGFMVQRSEDAHVFTSMGYMVSKGKGSSKRAYAILDKQAVPGVNYYRLQMLDRDGKFSYSKIVSVVLLKEIFSFEVAPNPAGNILFIHVKGGTGPALFTISDESGRRVKKITVSLYNNTPVPVNISALPKGIYNLQLITQSARQTKQFVKE